MLEVSLAQFCAFLDLVPISACVVDDSLRLHYVNRKARPTFGEIQDLEGRDLKQVLEILWPKETAAQLVLHFQATLRTGESHSERFFFDVRSDRGIREFYEWEISRITLKGGQRAVVCYFTENSAQMLAQQELQESENRKSAILEVSLDAIITMDHEGKVADFNPAAERIFGYSRSEAIGQPLAELIIPTEFRNQHYAGLARYLATGEGPVLGRRMELRALHQDGHQFPVELSISRMAGRGAPMFTSTIRDISERKQAEEVLRDARERLEVTLRAAEIGTWTWDIPNDRIFADPNLARMYSVSAADAQGGPRAHYLSALHPDDRAKAGKAIAVALNSDTGNYEVDYRLIQKDGSLRWVLARGKVQRDEAGKPSRMLGVAIDITARKNIEAALIEAQEKLNRHAADLEKQVADRTAHLNESIQSLEGVCYTIAHDLRAPVRAIQGLTRILADEYGKGFGPSGQDLVERIINGAARMDLLIRDLLSFAKLSHLDLPCANLDLNMVVKRVLNDLEREIIPKKAQIAVQPLPMVLANSTLAEQIFANLIGNSLKFVADGTAPRIQIWSTSTAAGERVFIKDNGIGIVPAHYDRIFGMFQRLHSDEARYPGTGVGLAIVKKGMERMNGRVGIDSSVTQGTCFYLDFQKAPGRP
jgi:PAS domain S-box-containing protein